MKTSLPAPRACSGKIAGNLVIALLIFLLVAAVAAYLIYPMWRMPQHVEASQTALRAGDLTTARQEAEAALRLRPGNRHATLALADVLEQSNPQEAYLLLGELVEGPQDRLNDRLRYVRLGQEIGRAGEVAPLLERIAQSNPSSLEVLVLQGQQHLIAGELPAALEAAEAALTLNPQNPSALILHGLVLLRSQDPVQLIQAKQSLLLAMQSDTREGLRALFTLAQNRALPMFPEDIARVAERLENHPLGNLRAGLSAVSLRLRLEPENREEWIEQAIERYGPEDPLATAAWLNAVGEPERTLDLLPHEEALRSGEALNVRLSALVMAGRTPEAEALLEQAGETLLDPLEKQSLLAALSAGESGTTRSREAWEKAVDLAIERGNGRVLMGLGRMARDEGRAEDALTALTAAFETDYAEVAPPSDWETYWLAYLFTERWEEALQVSYEILDRFPNYTLNRNNLAYQLLLLDRDAGKARELAVPLVEQNPTVSGFRTTAALALLRTGEPARALEVMEETGTDWAAQGGTSRLIYALVLAANDREAEAHEIAAQINREALTPLEDNLLDSLEP